MTPLDHLRLQFVGLNEEPQYVIGFAIVSALANDPTAKRIRSERDFVKAQEASLALSRLTPRAVSDMVTAIASTNRASGEVLSVNAAVTCIGSQPGQGKRLDHLEEALTQTVAQASALIEQSRREVERSRVLLNDERERAGGAPAPV